MAADRPFIDSNVILYLLDDGPKAVRAEQVLASRGVISVQVLNEVLANALRKARLSWAEATTFLAGIRALCEVVPLDLRAHDLGLALGERYGFSPWDAISWRRRWPLAVTG